MQITVIQWLYECILQKTEVGWIYVSGIQRINKGVERVFSPGSCWKPVLPEHGVVCSSANIVLNIRSTHDDTQAGREICTYTCQQTRIVPYVQSL